MRPKDSIWTDEQWDAISKDKNNIIVSAGAGSGKTAVLTERVVYKLKQGVSIDNLIILTFTNAAAKEMKERIRDKIKDDKSLINQLVLLDKANITTFDAYSLSLVKKYHYLLGLSKNINIIDNIFLKINKKKILDDIFDSLYDNNDFIDFIDTFTNKDDEQIKIKIDEINNKLSNIYDKDLFFNKCLNSSEVDLKNEYIDIIFETKNTIDNLINEVINNIGDEKILSYFTDLLENIKIEDNNYFSYKEISNYSFKMFPRGKNIDEIDSEFAKKYLEKIKDYFKEFKELLIYDSEDEIIDELLVSKKYIKVIIDILKLYNEKIYDFKKKYNSFEFNDILFFSIKLLTENKNILDEIKYSTNEIMVDEFQDTNDNNEYFLSLISNNNLYMVGDVKQSIYKFRNANSKIFTNTYYDYKNGNGITIDLNKNFRSRKNVLDSINLIFEHIMDFNIGGVDYDEKQKLNFGNTNYLDGTSNYDLEILDYSYENYKKSFSKDEVEIFIIIDDIIDKIKNNYQVFDMKKKTFRSAKYSDFVILIDRKTSFDLYKKIFEYKNIPLIIHKDENFSYNNVIFVIKNILKLVNCLYLNDFTDFNYSFVSLLRSYIYEFDDEVIFKNIDNLLKCSDFFNIVENLKYLKDFYKENSLTDLLKEIYIVFEIYENNLKLSDIKTNNLKLDYLITISKNLESVGYDLTSFVNYFDELYESNSDITFSTSKDSSDAVNIMTIHKSKGLEFPICYFSSLYKEFNVRDVNDSFLFDSKYGIASPIFNEGIKDTILKKLIKKNYLKEDIEEKIRLFYVALTRAKEKIILVSNLNEIDKLTLFSDGLVNDLERLNYKSFNDMLVSIKKYLKKYIRSVNVNPSKDYELIRVSNYQDSLIKTDVKYEYKDIDVKLKKLDNIKFSSSYDFLSKDDLELGSSIHEVLEYLDFLNYKEDLDKYNVDEFISIKISKLFEMPFMQNIKKYYKEFEFIYSGNNGIIDLLIDDGKKMIVVDYKTSEINKESYINQVKNYMDIVNKIFNKDVEGYIYSIMKCEYIKVDEI